MAAYGIEAVECVLNEAGYPAEIAVQEQISFFIIATEAKTTSSPPTRSVEKKCARSSCRNQFTPRRRDQHTCGTPRCRQWWSRQQRTKNLTVARGWGGGGGDTRNRESGPANTGAVEANCDSPRSVSGGSR